MKKAIFDWKEYAKISRMAACEGTVLLRNEENALPLEKNAKVSLFGRIQMDYYKGGMGSGGMVNTPYIIGIPEGLKAAGIQINDELVNIYEEWAKENPFDNGAGWATEPLSQVEMPLTEEIVKTAAGKTETAIIIIGRSAGEDKDSAPGKGAYLLRDEEDMMLSYVCKNFKKTIVLLNVGIVMDMSWVAKYKPQAVLYVWQGGCEGGNAVADILTGKVNPSGRMADTLATSLNDYPSTPNFGDKEKNYYVEDVFVGYRYFESVAKDKVIYPFGYGISYTTFEQKITSFSTDEKEIKVSVEVKNTGNVAGKDCVQLYYNPAAGKLAKPVRNLIRFGKTKELNPNEVQTLQFVFSIDEMSSYDDGGYTGNKSCYVLEPGKYEIFAGINVRDAEFAGDVTIPELIVTQKLEEALSPVEEFERMEIRDGRIEYKKVPVRTYDVLDRIKSDRPADRSCVGDKGYKLADVYNKKVSMEDFLDQLSDIDLICMSRGEGMCSPKVTAGIAGSYGGVTKTLNETFGIPIGGVSDGPSGIRMDDGSAAFLIPIGTALACTFNTELITELFEYLGLELLHNKIDSLLGPGMNMHRNPLNGRNFEYFSEDPYLSGTMAVAELKGMHKYGTTGTIKHFACNDQETSRHYANSVVSERAIREIYLKPFEMAVKQGGVFLIMTTYGPVNGTWTAGDYDLNTTILRKEWGYDGLVMTDWWAKVSDETGLSSKENTAPMIRAQNDVYMVYEDAERNTNMDNAEEGLKNGFITRGELLRNAANICRVVMKSAVMKRTLGIEEYEIEEKNKPESKFEKEIFMGRTELEIGKPCLLNLEGMSTDGGTNVQFPIKLAERGRHMMSIKMKSSLGEVAQMNLTVSINKTIMGVINMNGTNDEWIVKEIPFQLHSAQESYFDFYFGQSGMDIGEIKIERIGDMLKEY